MAWRREAMMRYVRDACRSFDDGRGRLVEGWSFAWPGEVDRIVLYKAEGDDVDRKRQLLLRRLVDDGDE